MELPELTPEEAAALQEAHVRLRRRGRTLLADTLTDAQLIEVVLLVEEQRAQAMRQVLAGPSRAGRA
jgi:hypothetical protein